MFAPFTLSYVPLGLASCAINPPARTRLYSGGTLHQTVRAEAARPAPPTLQRGRRAVDDFRPRGLPPSRPNRLGQRKEGTQHAFLYNLLERLVLFVEFGFVGSDSSVVWLGVAQPAIHLASGSLLETRGVYEQGMAVGCEILGCLGGFRPERPDIAGHERLQKYPYGIGVYYENKNSPRRGWKRGLFALPSFRRRVLVNDASVESCRVAEYQHGYICH